MKLAIVKRYRLRIKVLTLIAVSAIVLIAAIVFFVGPKNVYNDSLTVCSIINILLFGFLTIGLYKGIELEDNSGFPEKYKFSISRYLDFVPVNAGDLKLDLDFSEGPFGAIIGIIISIVAWIVLTIIIAVIFALLFAAAELILLLLFIALCWIFFRAMRLVFRKSEECHGNWFESLKYGVFYSVLYSSWLYGLIFMIHFLAKNR